MARVVIILIAMLPVTVSAQSYAEQRSLAVPATGLDRLLVDVGAGSLEIVGQADATEIKVSATVWVEDHPRDLNRTRGALDQHVRLELDRSGDTARLVTRTGDPGPGYSLPHVDLVVTAPSSLALTIEDRSGYIEVASIDNDVSVVDESGSIDLRDITGEVEIDDGSGSIRIARARGPVRIEDGSGSIDVEQVRDDVQIHDGSGSITVTSIRGDVTIFDGSGGISVDNVRGDVRVPDSGSGSVSIGRVAGVTSVE